MDLDTAMQLLATLNELTRGIQPASPQAGTPLTRSLSFTDIDAGSVAEIMVRLSLTTRWSS